MISFSGGMETMDQTGRPQGFWAWVRCSEDKGGVGTDLQAPWPFSLLQLKSENGTPLGLAQRKRASPRGEAAIQLLTP